MPGQNGMKISKKILSVVIVSALALSLPGCGSKKKNQAEAVSTAESAENIVAMTGQKAGISLPDETVSRWAEDGKSLQQLFRQHGIEASVSYAEGSAEKQAQDISGFISGGYDILIVAAVDENALASVTDRAGEAAIPVIAYDRLIRGTSAVTEYVAFDDYLAGHLMAQYVLDSLGLRDVDSSKIHCIEFAAGDKADLRQGYYYNGAYDTLRPYLDSGALEVLSGEETFSQAVCDLTVEPVEGKEPEPKTAEGEAEARMKRILSETYSGERPLDAVLCTDDGAARGVAKALGSGYSGKNDVIVTGMGAEEENLALIRDGRQSMTVLEQAEYLRELTVSLCVSLLQGESPDATLLQRTPRGDVFRYDTESYDNGRGVLEAYLAAPVVVNADNIDELTGGE